jgi:hypothetical protein
LVSLGFVDFNMFKKNIQECLVFLIEKVVTGQPLSGMTCNRSAKAVRAGGVRVGVWGKAPISINPDPIGADL